MSFTKSMLLPLNQLASGDEKPCLLALVIDLGIYPDIMSLSICFPSFVFWKYMLCFWAVFSFILRTLLKLFSLYFMGHFIAKFTKSLSMNGTRVSAREPLKACLRLQTAHEGTFLPQNIGSD